MDILESFFRWVHVVAGITWIGLLYFFNWINGAVVKTMDPETKKKVVPELMPRVLWWFRWGAAWTWFSGLLLLLLVFYHGGIAFEYGNGWTIGALVMLLTTFGGVFVYDLLMKSALPKKNMKATIGLSFFLIGGFVCLADSWGGFSYRSVVIHTGALFGTIMAFNVWFRIWPAQQKIVMAIKNGEAPDGDLVALAGLRSKHNTYMSVPLVWMMINAHTTWASSSKGWLLGVIALGWFITGHLYKRAGKIKGF